MLNGDWSAQKIQLKGDYKNLTDEDLRYEVGKETELLDRIAFRLEMSHAQVIEIINQIPVRRIYSPGMGRNR
jgi:hypothetical protein